MSPRPVLQDENGATVPIAEGDWTEFLDRRIVLSDGTSIAYRDFERLGPLFWARHRVDWDRVAHQLSQDLRIQLSQRGVATVDHFVGRSTPFNRYIVGISGDRNSVLGRLNGAIAHDRTSLGLMFDPAAQMGISQDHSSDRGGVRSEPLFLSWLGMNDAHIEAYLRTGAGLPFIFDDYTVMRAYLNGDLGVATSSMMGGHVFSYGPFHNDWNQRQQRRRSRVFRILRRDITEGENPDHAAKTLELGLAREVSQCYRRLDQNPTSKNAHRNFAEKLGKYLELTGIPNVLKIASDRISYEIHLTPLTDEDWRDFYSRYTSQELTEPPELVRLARRVHANGIKAVIATSSFLNFNSGVDGDWSIYRIFPMSVFAGTPIEASLLAEPNAGSFFDSARPMIRGIIPLMARGEGTPQRSYDPLSFRVNLLLMRRLAVDLANIRSMRLMIGDNIYRSALRERLVLMRMTYERIEEAVRISREVDQNSSNAHKMGVLEKDQFGALIKVNPQGSDPFLIATTVPHGVLENSELFFDDVSTMLSEAQELTRSVSSGELSRTIDLIEQVEAELSHRNSLTPEELEVFARRDRENIEKRAQDLSEATPLQYFEARFEDPLHWYTVPEQQREAIVRGLAVRLSTDSSQLNDLLYISRFYFEREDAQYGSNNHRLVDFSVVRDFYEMLQPAISAYPDQIIAFAKHMIRTSKSLKTKMYSFGLLKDASARDDESRALIIDEAQKISLELEETNVQCWAIRALAYLFPDAAVSILSNQIVHGTREARGSSFLGLKDNEIFEESALLAAVEGLNLPSSVFDAAGLYLRASRTSNPRVVAAIKRVLQRSITQRENLRFINPVLQSLHILDHEVEQLLIEWVTVQPEIDDNSFETLYLINPRNSIVISYLERRLQNPSSVWRCLTWMDMLYRVDPENQALRAGVEFIEQAQRRSNHSGFDQALFDEIRQAVRGR